MPEPLEASLELDLSDALAAVQSLADSVSSSLEEGGGAGATSIGAALESSISEAAAQITAALVDAIADAAGAISPIPVPVDEAGIASAVEAGVESAAPDPVPVEADTEQASQSLEGLGQSATAAGGEVRGAGESVAFLEGAAASATGSVGGLGNVARGTGLATAGAVGGTVALAAGVHTLFEAGVDAIAAQQRYNAILGRFASVVDRVDVGNLHQDLGELAITLGTDDEALMQAAASVFQFGKNAGFTGAASAQFTERIVALAARAVALKPSLGSVADVADTMTTKLARGGPFAAKLGVNLTSTQISAEAAALGLGDVNGVLTTGEKSFAAASLAAKLYGDHLVEDIAKGSENAAIVERRHKVELDNVLESLGKPLVSPMFDLIEESIPLVEDVGTGLGQLGRIAIPLVGTAARVVGPPLHAVADVLGAIPAPVLAVAAALFVMRNAIGATVAQTLIAGGPSGLPTLARSAATSRGGLVALGVGASIAGNAIGGTTGQAISSAGSFAAMGAALVPMNPLLGAAAGAAVGLAVSLIGGGESAEEMRERISKLAKELHNVQAPAKALAAFLEDAGQDATLGDDLDYVRKNLRALAEESPSSAAKVVEGMRSMIGATDPLTGKVTFTREQFRQLKTTVDESSGAFTRHDRATREAAASEQLLIDKVPTASEALLAQRDALDQFVNDAVGRLPTLDSVLSGTQQGLQAFGLSLSSSVSPEAFLANLQKSISGVINFQANLKAISDAGFTDVAAFIASQGPEVGGAYATAFLAANPFVQQATEDTIGRAKAVDQGYADFLAGPFAASVGAGAATAFGQVPGAAEGAMTRTSGAIAAGTGALEGAGRDAGAGVQRGVAAGTAGIPATAQRAVGGAVGQVEGLQNPAYQAGIRVGSQFDHGIAAGIAAHAGVVRDAARAVINQAEAAAKDEAGIGSPSKLFAEEVGRPIAQGIGLGVTSQAGALARQIADSVREAAQAIGGRAGLGFDVDARGAGGMLGGAGGGGVKVLVVRSLDELRRHLPPEARSDPAFLGGRLG